MSWHYLLSGEVTEETADDFISAAFYAHEESPDMDWIIHINCPGGSMEDGSAIYDALHRYSLRGDGTHEVTTIIQGKAYSIASVIAQAGDNRWCGPLSMWMAHEPETHIHDSLGNVAADVAIMKRWTDHVCDIFAERATLTPLDVRKNILNQNWYLDSWQLRSLGLVDRIV